MRCADVVQSFPSIVLVLCLVSVVGASVWNIILVIGFLGWTSIARLVYGNTLSIREKEYIRRGPGPGREHSHYPAAERAAQRGGPGVGLSGPAVGRAILSESSLSFLGVGIRTPQASWGNMIQYATDPVVFSTRPWVWVPPSLCIVVTVFCLQFIGDGLRDAMDPKWTSPAGMPEAPTACRETPVELAREMERLSEPEQVYAVRADCARTRPLC